jgi:uncharacterized protein
MPARLSLANHAHVYPSAINAEGTIDHLLKHMDTCDIAQAVCFAPFPHQAAPLKLDQNAWLAAELKSRDRLLGFGTLDFTRNNIPAQVRQIVDLGFKGIKIHPAAQDLGILSPPALEAYRVAQDADLFLVFHTGIHHHRLRDAMVIQWDEIAYEFPKLRFSMEHVGGWSFFPEALAVIANHVSTPWDKSKCTVFAGLTSIFSPKELPFWFITPERLAELVRQAGVDQLIFGLDFPYNDVAATRRGIETILSLNLPEADTAKILGGNLRRELGLTP